MFFNICFWFCGMTFDTPTMEKIIFLSSTVAMNCYCLIYLLIFIFVVLYTYHEYSCVYGCLLSAILASDYDSRS